MRRHKSILTRKRQLQLQVYSGHPIMKFIEESHTPGSWVIPQWPLAAPEARETGRCKLQDTWVPEEQEEPIGQPHSKAEGLEQPRVPLAQFIFSGG